MRMLCSRLTWVYVYPCYFLYDYDIIEQVVHGGLITKHGALVLRFLF